jgi:hypothetical protein
LGEEQDTIPIEIPDGFFEVVDPLDHEYIEHIVIEGLLSGPSTVKSLAGRVKGTDDPRIGVVVTFQSCLQLECDEKVVGAVG